ncbi:related to lysophospholipase [Melanopsichium pennsylvanicum]|uniref:Related to lysophospholipase n=2 Tax=Melanopsichium pennsylvanicum TaxID=63383 RepID=A0AAJ4XM08_9BASI|nr:related to lysophospholipase [Melanopsichium pennsylvanicum 4]SNX84312.1 related to lysophospholipase [Melanopsichium pennsylvanicum]
MLSSLSSTLWEVWGEPLAESLGAYQRTDRSYGRWSVPFSAMEKRLYEKDDVEITFHKVMMENGKDWVWYQVWQDPMAVRCTGRNADMIFVHGTGVHSGTLAGQCRRYLDAGFRLIVPDLPSHGFSSGLHVYQSSMSGFCTGLHAVLHDVAHRDQANSLFPCVAPSKLKRRKTFMLGLSFGGLVAFSYALQYPASYRYDETDASEIPIDGLIGVGPMVAYNTKFVVVNIALQWLFRVLLFVFQLGRLEVIVPHKKVVDKDPKVYDSLIMQDPRSHQGSFRIGHLHCIVVAMSELSKRAEQIRHPVYIQMGGEDRVADNEAALAWIRRTSGIDKRYEVYPICQHVIYKKAKNQHDDLAGRISVIADNVEWMVERSPATYLPLSSASPIRRQLKLASFASDGSSISTSTSRTSLFDEEDEKYQVDDSASVASTVSTTPTTMESEVFSGQREKTKVFGGIEEGHLLPQHLRGWRVDQDGEKRLFRLTWNFREDTRPFLYDPHVAPSPSQ